jgi:NNP family nitrate/nitrite transporter-like MFS transporter
VTFGSFIGFSMALPLSITVIFGVSHVPDAAGVMQHTLKNPNAPSALTYAWIGPFVGALVRPIGGWISDKVGGSIVTQVISAVMVGASVGVGYVMLQAYGSATPEQYFSTFMWLFIVLFAASGIGNGSTFRTIGVIFDRQQAGPVLGWTSAVAAYGAFIAPVVIGATDQGWHAAVGHVRFCRVLRPVLGAELVVLPAGGLRDQKPLKSSKRPLADEADCSATTFHSAIAQ